VVLALIGLILTTVATVPIEAEIQQRVLDQQMEAIRESDPEAAQQVEQMQGLMGSPVMLGGIGLVFAMIGLFIGYLIRAAILFSVGLLFGGRASFRQVFRMSVWTTLPDVFRNLVAAIVVFATGDFSDPGLSHMFTDAERADLSPILLTLLSSIDIYWLWGIILIMAGAAATYHITRAKGFIIALIYWLITLGFSLGLVALGQAVSSAFAPG
jgi:hypothetical protein